MVEERLHRTSEGARFRPWRPALQSRHGEGLLMAAGAQWATTTSLNDAWQPTHVAIAVLRSCKVRGISALLAMSWATWSKPRMRACSIPFQAAGNLGPSVG